MIEEDIKESPVEVTLSDDPITEVALDEVKPSVSEDSPKIKKLEEGGRVADKEDEPRVDEREKALADLKKQYERQKQIAEAEREARKQAEYYARQQAQQVGYARNEVQDSNLKIILNAIDATEQAAANAERDYAMAMANGDYANAARAQRLIAQAESHLLQLQNGKNRLEETLQQPAEGSVYEQQVPSFEPRIPQDPVEMYASRLAPKSAQWLRNHPEAAENIEKLTAAHAAATQLKGYEPESKEYFKYIEKQLGYGADEEREPAEEREVKKLKPNMSSAPVSSGASVTSSRSNGSANTMTLSSSSVRWSS